jgi:hypothetical protein
MLEVADVAGMHDVEAAMAHHHALAGSLRGANGPRGFAD